MQNFRFSLLPVSAIICLLTVTAVQAGQSKPTSYQESDFSKKELDLSGLSQEQKQRVLKLLNHNDCACSCSKGTWANCIKTDTHCPYSRPMGARVAAMIKEGKPEEFILGFLEGWQEGSKRKKKGRKKEDPNKIYPVTTLNAPVKGPKDAPVTVIEYISYQCFYCQRVQPTIKALLKEYPGKIRHAVMNNPLSFQKNALPAALAARAAGRQGKFWEMHELIFENAKNLDQANLLKLAEKLGLDIEKFNADRHDEQLKAEILKEQAQAVKNGATGTPAFFINGKKLTGAKPLPAFKAAIEETLQKAKKADSPK